jgi:TrmH family RNA methyltransferase
MIGRISLVSGWKDNVYFVLVEPKESGNIGASARALKNMGFKNLCLVKPPDALTYEAKWFAHNALDVLESAGYYDTIKDVVKDKALVVGVARRVGKKRGVVLPIDEGAKRVIEFSSSNNKVALLFGREDRGLYNEEIDECGIVLTIPSNKEHPSLNLSHAVMVTAYELAMSGYKKDGVVIRKGKRDKAVGHGELTSLYERIEKALILLDYLPRGDRDIKTGIMSNITHILGRAGITDWELKMLHGLCSQIEKKIKNDV